jgi:hypothetical protein
VPQSLSGRLGEETDGIHVFTKILFVLNDNDYGTCNLIFDIICFLKYLIQF